MTLGNCEPVSFQLCCQCYDITSASMVFQSATATCSTLEKEVSFFGSHQMSYPVPTGKNDDFSPWSPSLKKVLKRGLMERGDERAAGWDYEHGRSTWACGCPGWGSIQRKLRLSYCSRRTVTLALSGSPENCRLALGRKATSVLWQFGVWLGVPPSSAISAYISVYAYHSAVSLDSPGWNHHSKLGQAGVRLPPRHCSTGIAQGQRCGPESGETRITWFLCCLFCWLDFPDW